MPTHYPGPLHCNSLRLRNPVRSCGSASTTGDIGVTGTQWESECSPAFWAGHCAVHGYSPVVVLCSVFK